MCSITSNWLRKRALHLTVAALALFLLGAIAGLLANSAAAQKPTKKPPEEVEEVVPQKPKGTLRVDDDGAEGKQSRGEKTAAARLADLNADARHAKSEPLRDVYRKFSAPYDVVHY